MAIAWPSISSKVSAHPPSTNEACKRRCWNGTGRSGVCIPHLADRRKQEVLGVRDAKEAPLSPEIHTRHRRSPCPQPHEAHNNTPKPDGAVIAQRTSASRETAAMRNTPPKLSSRLLMIWGFRQTS